MPKANKPINSGYTVIMGTGTGTNGANIDVWIEYKITNVDTTNLTSVIQVKFYAEKNGHGPSGSSYSSMRAVAVKIDGSSKSTSTAIPYDFSDYGPLLIWSGNATISQPSGAEKRIPIIASFTTRSDYITGGYVGTSSNPAYAVAPAIGSSVDPTIPVAPGGYAARGRSVIKLFESTEMAFLTNGLGYLSDAVTCFVSEELNGQYELEMTYPMNGIRYELLSLRRIIVSRPNPYSNPQAFRIYNISRPIGGLVTVNAAHISYDLSGYPTSKFTGSSASDTLAKMKSNCPISGMPFSFSTDISSSESLKVLGPASIRSLMSDEEGCILDVYGGEWEFDNFDISLKAARGAYRGTSIRYGKNMTDLKQEENCSEVYTGIYPYYYTEDDGLVEISGKILNAEGTYDYTKILTVDLTSEFDNKPSSSSLKTKAEKWLEDNEIGVPKVNLTVSFVQLAQAREYETLAVLEDVRLGDTVTVAFPKLRVSGTSKCIKTVYNCITGQYASIELGDSEGTIADTVYTQRRETDTKVKGAVTKVTSEFKKADELLASSIHSVTENVTNLGQTVSGLLHGEGNITVKLSAAYIQVPIDTQNKPVTYGDIDSVVQVYKGISPLTAVFPEQILTEDYQFKVEVTDEPPGMTVTQETPGTLAISYAPTSVISDMYEIPLEIYTYDGETSESPITRTSIIVVANLNPSIIDNASAISQLSNEIEMKVSQTVYSDFVNYINTQFSLIPGQIEARFTSVQDDLNTLTDDTTGKFQTIEKYIRFVDGDIVVGDSTSNIKLKMENDIIYFFSGDDDTASPSNAIAYFSAGKLYVTDISLLEQLTIGNFAFTPDSNGHLSFRKVTLPL